MITQVHENLFIADIEECGKHTDAATIHACKHPCYKNIVGKVEKDNPNYLHFETPDDLYLNMIDGDYEYFNLEQFFIALIFINKNIKERKVVIHCNKGVSRSPSIAMLYLFRNKFDSFKKSQKEFENIYPEYNPSNGVEAFLNFNWDYFCDTK